jgi:hypothetical protein
MLRAELRCNDIEPVVSKWRLVQRGHFEVFHVSAFFKDSSVVGQNCQRAHFPCPLPRIVCDCRRCEPNRRHELAMGVWGHGPRGDF